jgi:hypothetical protein
LFVKEVECHCAKLYGLENLPIWSTEFYKKLDEKVMKKELNWLFGLKKLGVKNHAQLPLNKKLNPDIKWLLKSRPFHSKNRLFQCSDVHCILNPGHNWLSNEHLKKQVSVAKSEKQIN